jgi:nicotinamide-nucleotide adenylyltransferase
MTRGLYIGRFQPIHLGHLLVIEEILEKVDELVVLIAAAQFSHTAKNPLTAGERLHIVRNAIIEKGINIQKVWILSAQDIMDNVLWVPHIMRLLPPVDIFFSNNPFTMRLFTENDIQAHKTSLFHREKFSATSIREKIAKGENLSDVLLPSTIGLLKKWDIRGRLIAATTNEVEQHKNKSGPEFLDDF